MNKRRISLIELATLQGRTQEALDRLIDMDAPPVATHPLINAIAAYRQAIQQLQEVEKDG